MKEAIGPHVFASSRFGWSLRRSFNTIAARFRKDVDARSPADSFVRSARVLRKIARTWQIHEFAVQAGPVHRPRSNCAMLARCMIVICRKLRHLETAA